MKLTPNQTVNESNCATLNSNQCFLIVEIPLMVYPLRQAQALILMFYKCSMCFHPFLSCLTSLTLFTELIFTWIFNEYPSFVIQDTRRFVSQKTGNLYIAKVEPSDVGNYTCVVTNTVTKNSVQGPPTPLVLRVDGTR